MNLENLIEKVMFASRWIMAPFYFGLILCLALLLYHFCVEIIHFAAIFTQASEAQVILFVLTLIDLSLAGNLLVIVIFSGYENFVSKIDVGDHPDKPSWMGHVDFSNLKLKLISSIVAISGIHLLKIFMGLANYTSEQLTFYIIIHLTFIVSGLLLAIMDWFMGKTKHHS